MCRHLGWLGEPRSIASLVLEPPSGLLVQSYAPRRQKHGLMNADGWGVGFFDNGVRATVAQRRAAVGRRVIRLGGARVEQRLRCRGGAFGQRRHADRTLGVGAVHRRAVAAVAQRARRPRGAAAVRRRRSRPIDSALLAALIFERGLDALGDTIVEVAAADPNARLNILAANGSQLLATTWGDTLSVLRRDDGVVLASEPYDDNPGLAGDPRPPPRRGRRTLASSLIPLKGSS